MEVWNKWISSRIKRDEMSRHHHLFLQFYLTHLSLNKSICSWRGVWLRFNYWPRSIEFQRFTCEMCKPWSKDRFCGVRSWLTLFLIPFYGMLGIERLQSHVKHWSRRHSHFFSVQQTIHIKCQNNPFMPSVQKKDVYKQCRPRSDAAESGVWSGTTLFALRTGISLKHGNTRSYPVTHRIEMKVFKALR